MSKTNLERLNAIENYIDNSPLTPSDKRNAKNIVKCLKFLNSPEGQNEVISSLRGNWLGTVYQWAIPGARGELLAIHFDRENDQISAKDVVVNKTEIMTFTFCQAFEVLDNDAYKCLFLAKLSEGACIEGRMEGATNFSTNIQMSRHPRFQDLMQMLHNEAIAHLRKDQEIYIEDIIDYLFPKYADHLCQSDVDYCPEGKLTPDIVATYLMITLNYENAPEVGSPRNSSAEKITTKNTKKPIITKTKTEISEIIAGYQTNSVFWKLLSFFGFTHMSETMKALKKHVDSQSNSKEITLDDLKNAINSPENNDSLKQHRISLFQGTDNPDDSGTDKIIMEIKKLYLPK